MREPDAGLTNAQLLEAMDKLYAELAPLEKQRSHRVMLMLEAKTEEERHTASRALEEVRARYDNTLKEFNELRDLAGAALDARAAEQDGNLPGAWWEKGDAACPDGGKLQGGPPSIWVEARREFGPDGGTLTQLDMPSGGSVWCDNAEGRRHGPSTTFYPTGHKRRDTVVLAGKHEGRWFEWYDNGVLRQNASYKNGLEHGATRTWHRNRTPAAEAEFVDGLMHGNWKQWDESGKLLGEFEMNRGTGTLRRWFPNGKLEFEYAYRKGKRHGVWKRWDDSGTLRRHENFGKDELDGTSKEWNKQGQLTSMYVFRKGKLLKSKTYRDGKVVDSYP